VRAAAGIIGPTLTGWIFHRPRDYRFVRMAFGVLIYPAIVFVVNFKPDLPARSIAGR